MVCTMIRQNYARWDLRYSNPNDTFNYVQSLLNVIEMILGLYLTSTARSIQKAQMLAIVEICTCYKTIIYFAMEIVSGMEYTKHNHPLTIVFVALLSLPWIVFPAALAKKIMDRLLILNATTSSRGERKKRE